jgi:hypothetical protein
MDSPVDGRLYNITEPIVLDCSRSYDPEGRGLSIQWAVDGKVVSFSREYAVFLTAGIHLIELTLGDGSRTTTIDRSVIVVDRAPTVVLLVNGTVLFAHNVTTSVNETMVFDLSGSFDPDGTDLEFQWTIDGENVSSDALLTTRFSLGPHLVRYVVRDMTGMSYVGTFVVRAYIHRTDGPGPEIPEERKEKGDPWAYAIPIALILILALIAAAFFIMRRMASDGDGPYHAGPN